MVSFKDLSSEDQERVLEQARQIIDEENTKKHATAMYGLKKKDLIDDYLEILFKHFKIGPGPEQSALKQRYISMVNYLYKMAVDKKYHGNNIRPISTETEWITYQDISNKVKNMMIECKIGR